MCVCIPCIHDTFVQQKTKVARAAPPPAVGATAPSSAWPSKRGMFTLECLSDGARRASP